MNTEFFLLTPRPYDFGDGIGAHRPSWKRIIRKADLTAALERGADRGRPVRHVHTYSPSGEKIKDILDRLPPGLAAAYEKKHGGGLIHRDYIGTGAIIEPFTLPTP